MRPVPRIEGAGWNVHEGDEPDAAGMLRRAVAREVHAILCGPQCEGWLAEAAGDG
jgi:hypothetical protein